MSTLEPRSSASGHDPPIDTCPRHVCSAAYSGRNAADGPSPPARASSAQHERDEAPDLTPDRGRLLAPGHGFGRPPAVLPVRSPAPLQTLAVCVARYSGRRASGSGHSPWQHRDRAFRCGCGRRIGALPEPPEVLSASRPPGVHRCIHRSPPSARWAPRVELLTAPATIAWPPSDTCTCCTVTTCRPPVLIRPRASSPSWYAFIILAAALRTTVRLEDSIRVVLPTQFLLGSPEELHAHPVRCSHLVSQHLLKTVPRVDRRCRVDTQVDDIGLDEQAKPRSACRHCVSARIVDSLLESPVVADLFRGDAEFAPGTNRWCVV